jgi:leukotriene-A4 hydrolase
LAESEIIDLTKEKVQFLAEVYKFENTRNAEIRFRFMRICIRARLMDMMNEILKFLNSNFRIRYLGPIYRDLAGWPEAKPLAIANFKKVRNQMTVVSVDAVVKNLGLSN